MLLSSCCIYDPVAPMAPELSAQTVCPHKPTVQKVLLHAWYWTQTSWYCYLYVAFLPCLETLLNYQHTMVKEKRCKFAPLWDLCLRVRYPSGFCTEQCISVWGSPLEVRIDPETNVSWSCVSVWRYWPVMRSPYQTPAPWELERLFPWHLTPVSLDNRNSPVLLFLKSSLLEAEQTDFIFFHHLLLYADVCRCIYMHIVCVYTSVLLYVWCMCVWRENVEPTALSMLGNTLPLSFRTSPVIRFLTYLKYR